MSWSDCRVHLDPNTIIALCATSTLNLLCNIELESARLQAPVSRGWAANKVPSSSHAPSLTVHSHISVFSDKIGVFAAKCQAVFLPENSRSPWQEPGSPSLWTWGTLCLEKSSFLVQSSGPRSPVWDRGSWALLQVCLGRGVTESMMQGTHQPLETLSLIQQPWCCLCQT